MITGTEERWILGRAYIPEHVVGLMSRISGAEPYLIEDYLCFNRTGWVILVGYPLETAFSVERLAHVLDRISGMFKPVNVSIMAPELPAPLAESCSEHESDYYYTLDLLKTSVRDRPARLSERAREELKVERGRVFGASHSEITGEFLGRVSPPQRVKNLFLKIPDYVSGSPDAVLLSAWNREGKLSAYYVVDLAADDFSNYVIGCHSKRHYVKGASDLLFLEMINMSRESRKKFIHLGLGVNRGIRQFKKKWGGKPTLGYEMCELVVRKPTLFETVASYLLTR